MINLKIYFPKLLAKITEIYGRSLIWSIAVILIISLFVCTTAFLFFNSAAPNTITIASGPKDSGFRKQAEKYKKILEKEGVKVKILPSDGSTENLRMLADSKIKVDVGFVQGGQVNEDNIKSIEKLVSLGSVSYQPLMIFYRGEEKQLLSQFAGKRIYIGEEGSGTHSLALAILKENGIDENDKTKLITQLTSAPGRALLDSRIDAIFIMGDSASTKVMRELAETPGIHLYNFIQADGYTRRIKYLNKLELPQGAFDLGKNIPAEDTLLVGPTVELIARDSLHPALSDLLLGAAREVHGSAGMFRKSGQFPAPLEHEFRLSEDASRYYASGKSFLYRTFPFWLASLISRILAVIVPIALLLIPGLRIAPAIYRWHMQSRIYPWYKALLELERDAFSPDVDASKREALLHQLDHIENTVNKIKIPASFGDLFYGLRGHISFVRDRLMADNQALETQVTNTKGGA
ncbi:MAG TPA: TAXI family TRAP transporter solute-binding subunit [Methylophilaceae bacterium]|nr:TAXI family TRAP transporter solute-binding subunit [Methylophilaceae bacterium]